MYEIIISNYLEFEKDLINLSLENLVREKDIYADGFVIQSTLNRRLTNLLSSIKLYQDSLRYILLSVFNNLSSTELSVSALFSWEYDNNKYYRLVKA